MATYGALEDGPRPKSTSSQGGAVTEMRQQAAAASRFHDPTIVPRNVFMTWFTQFSILTKKNLYLLWHKKIFTLSMLIIPSLFVIILWWMSSAIGHKSLVPVDLNTLPKCQFFDVFNNPVNGETCITVMYAPQNEATDAIFKDFADAAGLGFGTDVMGQLSVEAMSNFVFNHMGVVDTAIVMNQTDFSGLSVDYTVWTNTSRFSAYADIGDDALYGNANVPGRLATIQNLLDGAIIGHVAGVHGIDNLKANVNPSVQFFEVEDENNLFNSASANLIAIAAPTLLVCGITVYALMMLNIVTTEKHNKLLGALRTVGVWDSSHWLSWFVVVMMTSIPLGLLAAAFGKASGVSLFFQCTYTIHAVAFFLFATAFAANTIWIGSFVAKPVWVNVMSFTLFTLATVIAFVFTTLFDIDTMYSPTMSFIVKFILFLMPYFHYCKILRNIITATAAVSSHQGITFFTWADITKEIGPLKTLKSGVVTEYYAPSPAFNMGMLAVLVVIYLVLAWYFGQVFAGDLGASQRFYFPFSPAYWGFVKPEQIIPGDTLAVEKEKSRQERSIRLHKLSKSYDKTTALKEVSMELQESQCLALLGQNGAGKTTLVNVVSGLLAPTHGHAFIFGDSVQTDIATLRGIMGTCPQHDLLWLELTARQHLEIYARLKGVSASEVADHVVGRLAAVNLQDDADVPVTGFSGGMKRRLSVAIASMGSPRVLFLDEPTTGMDPLSRRRVWSLIEDLKVGRVVLLTTHSMEEADALGDQIAIMASGKLRAVGTSLFLKNRFGAGYQINLLSTAERADELKALVDEFLPGAEIIGDNAGNITVGLPRRATAFVPQFLRKLAASSTDLVKEWGLSNSTLDEVFLRLAVQAQGVSEGTEETSRLPEEEDSGRGPRGVCVMCQERPAVEVALFTSQGVTVMAPDLVCKRCSELSPDAAAELPGVQIMNARRQEAEAAREEKVETPVFDAKGVPITAEVAGAGAGAAVDADASASAPKAQGSRKPIDSMEVTMPKRDQIAPVSPFHQGMAVLGMRTQMQLKQRKTNCCYLVFLIIIVLVTYLLEPSVKKQDLCPQGWEKLSALADDDDGGLPVTFDNCQMVDLYEWLAVKAVPQSMIKQTNWFEPPFVKPYPNWETNQLLVNTGFNNGGNSPGTTVWYVDATGGDNMPLSDWNILSYGKGKLAAENVVTFEKKSDPNFNDVVYAAQKTIASDQRPLPCPGYNDLDGYVFSSQDAAAKFMTANFPDLAITMQVAQPTPKAGADGTKTVEMSYMLHSYNPDSYYQNAQAWYTSNATSTGGSTVLECTEIYVSNDNIDWEPLTQPPQMPIQQAINAMNNGLLNTILNTGNENAVLINANFIEFPPFEFPTQVNELAIVTQSFLFPLFTMFLLPPFVSTIVGEKETRLYQMMKMEGMKSSAYWMGTYVFNVIYFLIIGGIYIICGYAASIGTVTHASPLLFLAVLLLWGHAQAGFSFFLGALFPRARLSSIVSYMLVVLVAITSGVLAVQNLNPWPTALLWVTPLGYSRVIILVLKYGGQVIPAGSELSKACILLFITGTIEMFVGMYLHAVIPDIDNTRASPLLCLYWCRKRRPRKPRAAATASLLAGAAAIEDEDVIRERERVNGTRDPMRAVAIQGLEKAFYRRGHEPKLAVRGVTLAAEYGTTLGLLGPNGAGKTTTIAMLTGQLHRTAGLASVGGYDTSTDMDLVYRILGVCPQFDTVWDDLTCSEHLWFYGLLKGIPRSLIKAAVQRTAEKVNLDGDCFNMKSSELSGGMKRRLSLGIALIGDPKVVFLDEPTTGLDPETRRTIWDIIQREQQDGRCILLTTHAMEEADTLCSRIAIMAHGKLRCIGTQLHLKNRFGDGYKLSLILKEEGEAFTARAERFVHENISSRARRMNSVGKTVDFVLPRTGVDVATLFQILEARKAQAGISEFGVSAASLEEVFVKVVTQAEDEEELIIQNKAGVSRASIDRDAGAGSAV